MAKRWLASSSARSNWGRLQVTVAPPGGAPVDVTFFRDSLTRVLSWSSSDPFDDATCQVAFDQLSPFDDFGVGDLAWLKPYSNIDIYFVPDDYPSSPKVILWEGMLVSLDIEGGDTGSSVTVSGIGALYQLDFYVRTNRLYSKDQRFEDLIAEEFSRSLRPHLRTGANLKITWPSWWSLTEGGKNITGYKTRNSDAGGRSLTGYIQDLLGLMVYEQGKQWTVMKNAGRKPVLKMRGESPTTWTVSALQPGVALNFTRDHSQSINVIYGEGTDAAGIAWANRNFIGHDYFARVEPLAWDRSVHPTENTNLQLDPKSIRIEEFYSFSTISQDDAQVAAHRKITRERDPGWSGSITLSIDPEEGSRFRIKAGSRIKVRHLAGSGQDGIDLHVARCEVSPEDGTVALTVDNRARDALTVEQALARIRDTRDPAKLLRINRSSKITEDRKAPWDYNAGSGYAPLGARSLPWGSYTQLRFPDNQDQLVAANPPFHVPGGYVEIDATSTNIRDRWAFFPVHASSRDRVGAFECGLYNSAGQRVKIGFHVSIYDAEIDYLMMPLDSATGTRHPFFTDAFQYVEGATTDFHEGPTDRLIVGWGDGDNKAGFWPGLESEGDPETGLLKDDGGFEYNMENSLESDPKLWMAVYVPVHTEPVFFVGRMYKSPTAD